LILPSFPCRSFEPRVRSRDAALPSTSVSPKVIGRLGGQLGHELVGGRGFGSPSSMRPSSRRLFRGGRRAAFGHELIEIVQMRFQSVPVSRARPPNSARRMLASACFASRM
jgi:hypothetical protein